MKYVFGQRISRKAYERFSPTGRGPTFAPHRKQKAPCQVCAMPPDERLKIDWMLLSGYWNTLGYREHLKHVADEITAASKYRDGTYGDTLLNKLEWAMNEMQGIAEDMRQDKPKVALLALKNLGDLAGTQAKILGLGVPRQQGKNSLHLHLGKDVKPADLSRAIDAYQRTQLPAPAAESTVEVVVEDESADG